MIEYRDSPESITPEMLGGFFVGWKRPHDPTTHLKILRSSDLTVLAIDSDSHHVVRFVVSLTDGVQQSFIYILEVLPDYRRQGIGTQLVERILA